MRVLCLGDPRHPGDIFGPLVGSRLKPVLPGRMQVKGTLTAPVTADDATPAFDWLLEGSHEGLRVLVDTCLSDDSPYSLPRLVKGLERDWHWEQMPKLVTDAVKERIDRTVFLHVMPGGVYRREVLAAFAKDAASTIRLWLKEEEASLAKVARGPRV